jgi:fructose-bisphosphate aldolase class II
MKTLREVVAEAQAKKVAVGHFNISNIEGFWAVVRAAKNLNVPAIIGVSEGERAFIGVAQVKALVDTIKADKTFPPIFLNADHTYSYEKCVEVIDAGFDAVIFDGTELSFEDNIATTKKVVEYAKKKNPGMLIEGELGYIGKSSEVRATLGADVEAAEKMLTMPEDAKKFVEETGINLLAPAVGNFHGVLKSVEVTRVAKKVRPELVLRISQATQTPLVLHGGSGTDNSLVQQAIQNGIAIVHVNTEMRMAYRNAIRASLQENPDEVAPYKIAKPAVGAIQKVVEEKLKLFNNIG